MFFMRMFLRIAILVLLSLPILATTVSATDDIYRVKADSIAASPDGESWDTAFRYIQDGVEAAFAAGGGDVWVAAGTYVSSTNPRVSMRSGVAIYGGFSGTEALREERDWNTNVTVIDGNNEARCVTGADNALLDGFTITRGSAFGIAGGMYNNNVSPTVRNCLFISNGAASGGGMYNSGAAPEITECTFNNNAADFNGGAITNSDGAITMLSSCVFLGNRTYKRGGAIHNSATSVVLITACEFTNNTASEMGGALYNASEEEGVTLTDCVFTGNASVQSGGAVHTTGVAGGLHLEACTFNENNTGVYGGAVYNNSPATRVDQCIFTAIPPISAPGYIITSPPALL
jgi:hypothetical protein